MHIKLNKDEMDVLFDEHLIKGRGGFQGLVSDLRSCVDMESGHMELDAELHERLKRYAFKYGEGGWQGIFLKIFGRTLGPDLDGKE